MDNLEGRHLPVLAARNVVIFPGTTLPLNVGRAKSVAAIEAAHGAGDLIVVIAQKSERDGDPAQSDLYRVGTVCKIEKMRGSTEHGYQVLVRGVARVKVKGYGAEPRFYTAEVEAFP